MLDKEASFREAIEKLIAFRAELFGEMTQYVEGLPTEASPVFGRKRTGNTPKSEFCLEGVIDENEDCQRKNL
ncbi:MAG: hypothetical protein J5789_07450 [Oscillospiraceae bacterium]|nr:hypothetical protein [Oscillospiraceae bacterium]